MRPGVDHPAASRHPGREGILERLIGEIGLRLLTEEVFDNRERFSFLLATPITFGAGLWLSALNVEYRTDLANGTLLCHHHHQRAHDPRYDQTRLANGDYRFTRRQ